MTDIPERMRVLILGGSTEASALAASLADDTRFAPVLSLAGRTSSPRPQPIPCRVGGFGGASGLADHLRRERVEALVDATHPFAARMSCNAVQAAAETGLPVLRIERPAWRAGPDDAWRIVPTMQAAAEALGPMPRRVLLTVGQQELAPFRTAGTRHHYVIRSIERPEPDSLPYGATVITAAGPFDLAAETRLVTDHGIEVLVTKNSGGEVTAAKLAAARAGGLPVVMVARPTLPEAETVPDAAQALIWLGARHAAWRGV